jgi:hypothetical protein
MVDSERLFGCGGGENSKFVPVQYALDTGERIIDRIDEEGFFHEPNSTRYRQGCQGRRAALTQDY